MTGDQNIVSRAELRSVPPYMRRSPRLNEALPVLYLRGLSTGDFEEAIPVLLGADAAGFSPATITRLSRVWQDEYDGWRKRPLTGKEYVYVWADGVYFSVRLGEDKQLACLADEVVGVLPNGSKEVIALEDGYRESTESWLGLMDYKARYYSPYLACFISPDTLVPGMGSQAWNRYMYVNGNPIRYRDPSGHMLDPGGPTGLPPVAEDDPPWWQADIAKDQGDNDGRTGEGKQCEPSLDSHPGQAIPIPFPLPSGWQVDLSGWLPLIPGSPVQLVAVDANLNVTWYVYEDGSGYFGLPNLTFDTDWGFSAGLQVGLGTGADVTTGPLYTNAGSPEEYQDISHHGGFTVFPSSLGLEVDYGWSNEGATAVYVGFLGAGQEFSAWLGTEIFGFHWVPGRGTTSEWFGGFH